MNDSTDHYHPVSKLLHWLVAGMIVVQFVLAELADRAGDQDAKLRELALLANHKSVGITIFALAVLRLGWRFIRPPPALPSSMPRWQVVASFVSHWSLYALLLLMPVTGWLMSSASAYSVSWFQLIQLPDLVAPDPDLKDTFEEIHEFLAKVLFVIAGMHILAALKHAVIDRDGVLRRISSAVSIAVFIAVIVLGVATLGSAGTPGSGGSAALAATVADEQAGTEASGLARWSIDYEASYIRFTGVQAGARFTGRWPSWQADIRFAGDALDASRFDVTVRTTKVDTGDEERDATLKDPEWFHTAEYPEAYYRADEFTRNDDGSYTAAGRLVIKGSPTPVELRFSVERDGERRVLTGSAELDRLALDVGTGEWTDTTWIGRTVEVEVRVEATVAGQG